MLNSELIPSVVIDGEEEVNYIVNALGKKGIEVNGSLIAEVINEQTEFLRSKGLIGEEIPSH